jgi:hypothetical protein
LEAWLNEPQSRFLVVREKFPVPTKQFPVRFSKFPVLLSREFAQKTQADPQLFEPLSLGSRLKSHEFPVFSLFIREFERGDGFDPDCSIRQFGAPRKSWSACLALRGLGLKILSFRAIAGADPL